MISVVIVGKHGKMSNTIREAVSQQPDFALKGILSYRSAIDENTFNSVDQISDDTFTIVDFSNALYTERILNECANRKCRLVIGTSGLEYHHFKLIEELSKKIPILQVSNFSKGMFIINEFIDALLQLDLSGWSARVHDFHHAKKLDTPSATALQLASRLSGIDPVAKESISWTRLGDGVSEHSIFLHGTKERIDISHKLLSRETFISPVLQSIRFIQTKHSGRYSAADLFNQGITQP